MVNNIETIRGTATEVKEEKIDKGLTRLSFKIVVRTEDERQDIKEIVPVEIVGKLKGSGLLSENNRVEVKGHREGGILSADFAYNLTKSSKIEIGKATLEEVIKRNVECIADFTSSKSKSLTPPIIAGLIVLVIVFIFVLYILILTIFRIAVSL